MVSKGWMLIFRKFGGVNTDGAKSAHAGRTGLAGARFQHRHPAGTSHQAHLCKGKSYSPRALPALFLNKPPTTPGKEGDYIARANVMWNTAVLKRGRTACRR